MVSAIPNFLFKRAKELILSSIEIFLDEVTSFHLDESTTINLSHIKSKDFYWLLINKIHTGLHAGPKGWTRSVSASTINWQKVFSMIGKCSKEKKMREFHFKFIHRIIVTKKELFRFKLKEDGDCIYCEEADSIEHSFIDCMFTKSFSEKVLQWSYAVNASSFSLGAMELLFDLVNISGEKVKLHPPLYAILHL